MSHFFHKYTLLTYYIISFHSESPVSYLLPVEPIFFKIIHKVKLLPSKNSLSLNSTEILLSTFFIVSSHFFLIITINMTPSSVNVSILLLWHLKMWCLAGVILTLSLFIWDIDDWSFFRSSTTLLITCWRGRRRSIINVLSLKIISSLQRNSWLRSYYHWCLTQFCNSSVATIHP